MTDYAAEFCKALVPCLDADAFKAAGALARFGGALRADFRPDQLHEGMARAVAERLGWQVPGDYLQLRDAIRAAREAEGKPGSTGRYSSEAEHAARMFVGVYGSKRSDAEREVSIAVFTQHTAKLFPGSLECADDMDPEIFRGRGEPENSTLPQMLRWVAQMRDIPDIRERWGRAERMLSRIDRKRRPTVANALYGLIRECRVALGGPANPIPVPKVKTIHQAAPAPRGPSGAEVDLPPDAPREYHLDPETLRAERAKAGVPV